MTEIIGVRFKSGGKQYYFDPNGQAVAPGQGVIIETSRGLEYGECTQGNTMVEDEAVVQPLRPLVRLATAGLFHLPGEDRRPWPGYEAGGGGVQL